MSLFFLFTYSRQIRISHFNLSIYDTLDAQLLLLRDFIQHTASFEKAR